MNSPPLFAIETPDMTRDSVTPLNLKYFKD